MALSSAWPVQRCAKIPVTCCQYFVKSNAKHPAQLNQLNPLNMPLACNRILLKYNKEITPFKNITLRLTLTFQFVICRGNSMICSDIWHKYRD